MTRPRGNRGRFVSRAALSAGYSPENPRTCAVCGTTQTSQWRSAPDGRSLCNADGIRAARADRAHRADRAKRVEKTISSIGPAWPSYSYDQQAYHAGWHDDKLWAESRIASSRRRYADYSINRATLSGGITKPGRNFTRCTDLYSSAVSAMTNSQSTGSNGTRFGTDVSRKWSDHSPCDGSLLERIRRKDTGSLQLPALKMLYQSSRLVDFDHNSKYQNCGNRFTDKAPGCRYSRQGGRFSLSPVTHSSSQSVSSRNPVVSKISDSDFWKHPVLPVITKHDMDVSTTNGVVGLAKPLHVSSLLSSLPTRSSQNAGKEYPLCHSPTLSSTTLPSSPTPTNNRPSHEVCSLQNILN